MSTTPETAEYILDALGGHDDGFHTRAMFGEYALYADGKTVALICDDQLYVKIHETTQALADICEQDAPYPGAKPHYLIEESELHNIPDLPDILHNLSAALPKPKPKKKKKSIKEKTEKGK